MHQARVRADVVVNLIQEMKDRGHRAYKNLDMAAVRAKAFGPAGLPADGVPRGVVQLLKIKPEDDTLDKIQIQKEATPVPGRCQNEADAKRIFQQIAPNAVVCERSTEDGIDIVAQRASALQDIGSRLERQRDAKGTKKQPQKIAVSAGNVMLDQFKPWYYGVAFGFLFSYCIGMPDYPLFQEKQRYRRLDNAPRVEHPFWDQIMARRVEGQLVADRVPED